MFSGIIEEIGTVDSFDGATLVVRANQVLDDLKVSESIMVAGACLTVVELSESTFTVETVPETLHRTSFGDLKSGDHVNLERSLRYGDRVGGHMVQGHVDGVGTVRSVIADGNSRVIVFEAPEGEVIEFAHETLKELLVLMDLDADTAVRAPETPGDGVGLVQAVLDVTDEDMGVLIGRRGGTMASLQYLVNVMITRRQGSRVLVTVDAERYHRRREETLRSLARRMADRVQGSRRSMTLEPMPAAERRIIHLELSDDDDVVTGSVGMGDERKIVIRPARGERR